MQQLAKIVARQDANFKLTPSSSNETSINLPKEISSLISNESGEVTFTIYQDDFIKAVSALCLLPKIYYKKDQQPARLNEIFENLSEQIKFQFGNNPISKYTVFHYKRDDGRAYFNNLKQATGFNLRAFLVEQYAVLTFIRTDSDELIIRLHIDAPKEEAADNINIVEEPPMVDEPLQVIFYGAPGTGKSFAIDNMADESRTVRTTFHPDSDYASFVGAYKPTMEDVPISSIYGNTVQYVNGSGSHPGTEKKIVYKYVPQAFLKAYVAAWSDLSAPYFLVIEEINRGNCAQIFGDLFQLLDRNSQGCSSYAIHADEDIAQFLKSDSRGFGSLTEEQRNAIASFVLHKDNGRTLAVGGQILDGSLLLLPPNLYIWATMNTSDQSLFPIDSAFKRRWDMRYIPIDYDKGSWTFVVGGKRYRWGEFLRTMNAKISELTESPDKQMGYFFAKADKKSTPTLLQNDTISEDVFLNKVLFYIWTDVLKDYDAGREPFVNAETGRTYEFGEFFDRSKNCLQQFIDKLNLEIVGSDRGENGTGPAAEPQTEHEQ